MTTKTIEGNGHTYEVIVLDAETGLRVFHEYISVLMQSVPLVLNFFESKKEYNAFELFGLLPSIFTLEKIKDLAKVFLANAKIDGDVVDDTGIGAHVAGDPLRLYVDLFYAIRANYPKYIDPLIEKYAPFFSALTTEGAFDPDTIRDQQQ